MLLSVVGPALMENTILPFSLESLLLCISWLYIYRDLSRLPCSFFYLSLCHHTTVWSTLFHLRTFYCVFEVKTIFIVIIRCHLLYSLILSWVCSNFFRYWSRLNTEADMRIQLSPVKPDVRDLQKCRTVPFFSLTFFVWKVVTFL